MHADNPFESRFCWPAQDRARARNPLLAPRTPPVFTASIFSNGAMGWLLGSRRRRGLAADVLAVSSRPGSAGRGSGAARISQSVPDWRVIGEQDQAPHALG